MEKKSIKKSSFTTNTVSLKNSDISITGSANILADKEAPSTFVAKLRDSEVSYEYEVKWTDSQWHVAISITPSHFSSGTWDFYLMDTEGTRYRLKTAEDCYLAGDTLILQPGENGSNALSFYETVKGSLSMKVKLATVSIESFYAQLDDVGTGVVRVSGSAGNEFRQVFAQFVWINRSNKDLYRLPVKLNDHGEFETELDYKSLIPDTRLNSQWDLFLEVEKNGVLQLLRVKASSEELKENSRYLYKDETLYTIFFYSTVKGNVSVHFRKSQIMRELISCELIEDKLTLKGFGYLEAISLDRSTVQNRSLIVENQETGSRNSYPLPGIAHDGLEPMYSMAGFDIELSINEIYQSLCNSSISKDRYDFYLQITHDDEIYERKLGFKQFTYKKDGFLKQSAFKLKGNQVKVYSAVTPKGNLLIKTQTFSMKEQLYLKMNQIKPKLGGKEIWLIGERPDTAQDTGYHFFKYMRAKHPEVDAYYVIDPESADYGRVSELGNVLEVGSLKHLRIAASATAFIGSHDLEYIMPLVNPAELESYRIGKRVFLQHGVFGRKNVEYHKYYYEYPFKLFCVSSGHEKRIIEDVLEYTGDEVQITGLSRFDELMEDRTQNSAERRRSILVMPTWRDWLTTDEAFARSAYFEQYRALLANERLMALLEEHELTLDFYPHYRMQGYIEHFETLAGNRVHIIRKGEQRVQELLQDADLLVTDYSSVSFDMNYMKKPVVFYHFDSRAFFTNGILRPLEETFLGDIAQTADQVIDAIEDAVRREFNERKDIADKKNLIFDHMDTQNCERIYEAIMTMDTQKEE